MDDDDVIRWLFIHSHFCEVKQISSHRISWVKCTLAVHGYAAWDGSPTRHPHSRTYFKVTTGHKLRARLYAVHAYRRHSVINHARDQGKPSTVVGHMRWTLTDRHLAHPAKQAHCGLPLAPFASIQLSKPGSAPHGIIDRVRHGVHPVGHGHALIIGIIAHVSPTITS